MTPIFEVSSKLFPSSDIREYENRRNHELRSGRIATLCARVAYTAYGSSLPLGLGAAQLLARRVHQHEVRVRAAGDHAVARLLQAAADHPGVGHHLPLVLPEEQRSKSVALLDSGGIFEGLKKLKKWNNSPPSMFLPAAV